MSNFNDLFDDEFGQDENYMEEGFRKNKMSRQIDTRLRSALTSLIPGAFLGTRKNSKHLKVMEEGAIIRNTFPGDIFYHCPWTAWTVMRDYSKPSINRNFFTSSIVYGSDIVKKRMRDFDMNIFRQNMISDKLYFYLCLNERFSRILYALLPGTLKEDYIIGGIRMYVFDIFGVTFIKTHNVWLLIDRSKDYVKEKLKESAELSNLMASILKGKSGEISADSRYYKHKNLRKNQHPIFSNIDSWNVLSHQHFLMLSDLVRNRCNSLLSINYNDLCVDPKIHNLNLPDETEYMSFLKMFEEVLDENLNLGYNLVAKVESIFLGHVLHTENSDELNQVFPNFFKAQLKALPLIYKSGWLEDLISFLRKLSVGKKLEFYGCFRHFGHPNVDVEFGIAKKWKVGVKGKVIDKGWLRSMWGYFYRSFLESYKKAHGGLPPLDLTMMTPSYLKTELSRGNIPEDIENKVKLSEYLHIKFLPILKRPDTFDKNELISDKRCAPTFYNLVKSLEKNKSFGDKYERQVVLIHVFGVQRTVTDIINMFDNANVDNNLCIVLLRAKELEMKIASREFNLLTPDLRYLQTLTEKMTEQFLDYVPEITMTYGSRKLAKSLNKASGSRTLKEWSTQYTLCANLDIENWNWTQREFSMKYLYDLFNMLYGTKYLFETLGRYVERSTYISTDIDYPPVVVYNKDGSPEGLLYLCGCVNACVCGGEGMQQKKWTTITVAIIKFALRGEKVRWCLRGQGDNQVIVFSWWKPNPREINSAFKKKACLIVKRALRNIRDSFQMLEMVLKLEETWVSDVLFAYGKKLYIRGVEHSMLLKRASSIGLTSNDILTSTMGTCSNIMAGSSAVAKEEIYPITSLFLANFYTSYALLLSIFDNPYCDSSYIVGLFQLDSKLLNHSYGKIYNQDVMSLVHSLCQAGTHFSEIPSCNQFNLFINAMPDPLTNQIEHIKQVMKDQHSPIKGDLKIYNNKYLNNLLMIKEKKGENSKNLGYLISDPYAINTISSKSTKKIVFGLVEKFLIQNSDLIQDKDLKFISTNIANDLEYLISCVEDSAVINPMVLNQIFENTISCYNTKLLTKYSKTTTMVKEAEEKTDINLVKELTSAEISFWRVTKERTFLTNIEQERLLGTNWKKGSWNLSVVELADWMREKTWGKKIIGVTAPDPESCMIMEYCNQKNINNIMNLNLIDPGLINNDENNNFNNSDPDINTIWFNGEKIKTFGYFSAQIDPSAYKMGTFERKLGPNQKYGGSVINRKSNHLELNTVDRRDMAEKSISLKSMIGWALNTDPYTRLMIENLTNQWIIDEDNIVSTIMNKDQGLAEHRAKKSLSGAIGNCMNSPTTFFGFSSHTLTISRGGKDYNFAFPCGFFFIYMKLLFEVKKHMHDQPRIFYIFHLLTNGNIQEIVESAMISVEEQKARNYSQYQQPFIPRINVKETMLMTGCLFVMTPIKTDTNKLSWIEKMEAFGWLQFLNSRKILNLGNNWIEDTGEKIPFSIVKKVNLRFLLAQYLVLKVSKRILDMGQDAVVEMMLETSVDLLKYLIKVSREILKEGLDLSMFVNCCQEPIQWEELSIYSIFVVKEYPWTVDALTKSLSWWITKHLQDMFIDYLSNRSSFVTIPACFSTFSNKEFLMIMLLYSRLSGLGFNDLNLLIGLHRHITENLTSGLYNSLTSIFSSSVKSKSEFLRTWENVIRFTSGEKCVVDLIRDLTEIDYNKYNVIDDSRRVHDDFRQIKELTKMDCVLDLRAFKRFSRLTLPIYSKERLILTALSEESFKTHVEGDNTMNCIHTTGYEIKGFRTKLHRDEIREMYDSSNKKGFIVKCETEEVFFSPEIENKIYGLEDDEESIDQTIARLRVLRSNLVRDHSCDRHCEAWTLNTIEIKAKNREKWESVFYNDEINEDLEKLRSNFFACYEWVYKTKRLISSAYGKLLEIIAMLDLTDYDGFICLADGAGGFANLLKLLFPEKKVFFLSYNVGLDMLQQSLGNDCPPSLWILLNDEEKNLLRTMRMLYYSVDSSNILDIIQTCIRKLIKNPLLIFDGDELTFSLNREILETILSKYRCFPLIWKIYEMFNINNRKEMSSFFYKPLWSNMSNNEVYFVNVKAQSVKFKPELPEILFLGSHDNTRPKCALVRTSRCKNYHKRVKYIKSTISMLSDNQDLLGEDSSILTEAEEYEAFRSLKDGIDEGGVRKEWMRKNNLSVMSSLCNLYIYNLQENKYTEDVVMLELSKLRLTAVREIHFSEEYPNLTVLYYELMKNIKRKDFRELNEINDSFINNDLICKYLLFLLAMTIDNKLRPYDKIEILINKFLSHNLILIEVKGFKLLWVYESLDSEEHGNLDKLMNSDSNFKSGMTVNIIRVYKGRFSKRLFKDMLPLLNKIMGMNKEKIRLKGELPNYLKSLYKEMGLFNHFVVDFLVSDREIFPIRDWYIFIQKQVVPNDFNRAKEQERIEQSGFNEAEIYIIMRDTKRFEDSEISLIKTGSWKDIKRLINDQIFFRWHFLRETETGTGLATQEIPILTKAGIKIIRSRAMDRKMESMKTARTTEQQILKGEVIGEFKLDIRLVLWKGSGNSITNTSIKVINKESVDLRGKKEIKTTIGLNTYGGGDIFRKNEAMTLRSKEILFLSWKKTCQIFKIRGSSLANFEEAIERECVILIRAEVDNYLIEFRLGVNKSMVKITWGDIFKKWNFNWNITVRLTLLTILTTNDANDFFGLELFVKALVNELPIIDKNDIRLTSLINSKANETGVNLETLNDRGIETRLSELIRRNDVRIRDSIKCNELGKEAKVGEAKMLEIYSRMKESHTKQFTKKRDMVQL